MQMFKSPENTLGLLLGLLVHTLQLGEDHVEYSGDLRSTLRADAVYCDIVVLHIVKSFQYETQTKALQKKPCKHAKRASFCCDRSLPLSMQ